jgi:hypothetical protein
LDLHRPARARVCMCGRGDRGGIDGYRCPRLRCVRSLPRRGREAAGPSGRQPECRGKSAPGSASPESSATPWRSPRVSGGHRRGSLSAGASPSVGGSSPGMILDDTPRCACVCLYLLHVSYSEFSFSQQIRAVHTSTRMSSVVPGVDCYGTPQSLMLR